MKDNKKDLAELCHQLGTLKLDLDTASSGKTTGELVPRLSQTSM